jgi:two-component system NtrC family sensor kinase
MGLIKFETSANRSGSMSLIDNADGVRISPPKLLRDAKLRLPAANASAIGLLRVLLAASLLVPIALFGTISWLDYRAAINDAEHDLERTSEVGREHAEKIFDSQAQLADRINDLTRGLDANGVRTAEKPLHDTLNAMVARLPHVASVMISATDGQPLVSAEIYPVPRNVDLRGHDYFDAIIGGDKGPIVGGLQVGDVFRRVLFPVARPWAEPDGTLKGVLGLAESPSFFEDFYQTLVDEGVGSATGKVVTLVRADGRILVRYPPLTGIPPATAPPAGFLAATGASPMGGLYTSQSIIDPDSPLRRFAYRKVRGYPLYIAAGRSWSAILSDWRWTMVDHLLFGVPATLILFAATWIALARTRREEHALERANLEIQRREVAEDALLRAQRLEAVGQMTGGVAHDFNNLLTVIAGNAALIDKRANDPAAARRFAASIQLAAQRGAEITQQLLAFAGRQTIRPETINLNTRLLTFKPLLDRAASEAVQIDLDLDPGLSPVCIDPGQFESAILNLVGNARDAMPEGGRIAITTRNAIPDLTGPRVTSFDPVVRVTVSDTGIGMDRETLAKAFEPFFTTKGVGKGTGLGLSQVYGFARQAGGHARIISTPGAGTTIDITLPAAAQPHATEIAGRGASTPRTDLEGTVVLVVEDEPNVLEMAVETLEDLGYVAVAADSAHAALDRLRQSDRVDVLFTDVVMPGGMNGLQLSVEARRLRPDLKVLLTSGYTGPSGENMPGDIPLLPKPYDRRQLSIQIETVLAG